MTILSLLLLRMRGFQYECGILVHRLRDCRIQFDKEARGELNESTLEYEDRLRALSLNQRNKFVCGRNQIVR